MNIIIGSDSQGFELKEYVKQHLQGKGYDVVDMTPSTGVDFVESTKLVVKGIKEGVGDRGIVIDEYGAGSFMVANKHKGIICAEVSDEHSAKMTRDHNNATMIAIGAGVIGKKVAESIVDAFVTAEYSGGRHQVRVDMLNKMI